MAFRVDTRTVPADFRFEYWSEASCRLLLPMTFVSDASTPYAGRMWGEALGLMRVVSIAGERQVVRRAAAQIAAGDPEDLGLMIQRRGRSITSQGGRTILLNPGQMVASDTSRDWTIAFGGPFDVLVVQIPRLLLRPQADALAAGRIEPKPSHASARFATRLLLQIFAGLRHGEVSVDDEYLAESALDLVRGLCTAAPRAQEPTPRARAQQTLLLEIKRSIEAQLGDPALAPDGVARAHFISRRQLYNLFAADGWGVREWIRHQRLERARGDLRDPALRELSVTDVATRWGFAGATQFARAFRRAHGCAPSDYRSGSIARGFPARSAGPDL